MVRVTADITTDPDVVDLEDLSCTLNDHTPVAWYVLHPYPHLTTLLWHGTYSIPILTLNDHTNVAWYVLHLYPHTQ